MTLCIGLTAIGRMVLAGAMWAVLACISGCGGDQVGPDPLPWQPADQIQQRSG